MGQYCDSKVLELAWFNWLLSSATPTLEPYRNAGVLYTKVLGTITTTPNSTKSYPNPIHPTRSHCIVGPQPTYFNSYNGNPSQPTSFVDNKPAPCEFPPPATLEQASSNTLQRLCNKGYRQELPTTESWHKVLNDLESICRGISLKFNLSDDRRNDLASDAMLQTILKIESHRLVYRPGKAPVFNLLTTTIYRIMYSILNRDAKNRHSAAAVASRLGSLGQHGRRKGRRMVTVRCFGSLAAVPANT